ncbi:hypothetical protein [Ramlibacter sp.]|uniref:hypothetical protein n=1 Tax=Ramlibacter sp. TaxID=1917967 RepID=UPI002626E9F7|nr:hypothetical protein [Ramlibacter sp.]MDB5955294.1 hypothetical protein [Ramlibacter sp.]
MEEVVSMADLDDGGRRAVNKAAALAAEQLRYAQAIARNATPAGQNPDPGLVAALVQAIAINFAAVK